MDHPLIGRTKENQSDQLFHCLDSSLYCFSPPRNPITKSKLLFGQNSSPQTALFLTRNTSTDRMVSLQPPYTPPEPLYHTTRHAVVQGTCCYPAGLRKVNTAYLFDKEKRPVGAAPRNPDQATDEAMQSKKKRRPESLLLAPQRCRQKQPVSAIKPIRLATIALENFPRFLLLARLQFYFACLPPFDELTSGQYSD